MLQRTTLDGGTCAVVAVEGVSRGSVLGLIWEGLQVFKGRTRPSLRAAVVQMGVFTSFILPVHLFEHGCLFEFQQKRP